MSGMSSPRGLCTAPDLSDTATMIAPSLAIRSAATEPTFPNPCTATRAPLRLIPSLANASRVTNMHPRPVASRRPSEPPISTGFPVTTAVTVCRWCMEYVSMIHAMTRSLVFTSGAGTSESGPRVSNVPAPDVNTNERVMAWIMDTYSMHHRHTVTAVVTGKPIEMGGSLGRREATGRGCMIVTREALARLGMSLKGARIAVQGFGNVGSVAAQLLGREGCRIVAIGDRSASLYNERGIDIDDAIAHVKKNRSLEAYTKAEVISG